jgi:hypothetical protein
MIATGLLTVAADAVWGRLLPGVGVTLRWPNGETTAVLDTATGLGPARIEGGRR